MGFYRALGRQREVQSTVNVKITVSVWGGGGGGWLGWSKMAKAIEDMVFSDRENKSRLAVHLLNQ